MTQRYHDLIDALRSHIAALERPLLVMHAPADDTVYVENAAHIFAEAKHPKIFVSLDDADHLLTRDRDVDYVAALITAWSPDERSCKPSRMHVDS